MGAARWVILILGKQKGGEKGKNVREGSNRKTKGAWDP